MGIAQTLAGSAVAAIISGGIGFGSAFYLQERNHQFDLQRIEGEKQRAVEQLNATLGAEKAKAREARTNAMYVEWMSDPLKSQVRKARTVFENNEALSYADLASPPRAADREAVDAVLGFWARVDDAVAINAIDRDVAAEVLGPDARYWGARIRRLTEHFDVSKPGDNGAIVLAARGASHFGAPMPELPDRRDLSRAKTAPSPACLDPRSPSCR